MNERLLSITTEALRKISSNQNLEIFNETKITEDLGLESIDFVDFIFELEKLTKLNINIVQMSTTLSQGSARRFREVTVFDIVNYLDKLEQKN